MRKQILKKLFESFFSVAPIIAIVVILSITITPMTIHNMILFLISSVIMIFGITFFNLGVDISLMPIGENVGKALVKSKKLPLIIIMTFIIGVFISVAEPDLLILANQVNGIPDIIIILAVSLGVGIALVVAFLRILFQVKLSYILMFFYAIAFILSAFTGKNFISIAYESGGVTTGPIMVPFIMALGLGLASIRGDKNVQEDSFGLVCLCLICPIITMLLLGMFFEPSGGSVLAAPEITSLNEISNLFLNGFPVYLKQIAIALLPMILLFAIFQIISLKLHKRTLLKITIGTFYTYLGLVLFLTSVNVGFMPTGYFLGQTLIKNAPVWLLVLIAMVIGFFVVTAEPAVFVLKEQVESITEGAISAKALGLGLSVGVAVSLGLSVIRIVKGISILYFIIPGYCIALLLTFFVPPLFTSIAFDSGTVASGPLAATFILPFTIGACEGVGGNVFTDAFGVVALVALMPVITMQLFGVVYSMKLRAKQRRTNTFEEDTIIEYNSEGVDNEEYNGSLNN